MDRCGTMGECVLPSITLQFVLVGEIDETFASSMRVE
jgi:hypothetical protein